MTKLFAVVLLAAAVLGCQSKKPSTTPPTDQSLERKEGATGGAAYGGHRSQTGPDAQKGAPAPH